MKKIIALILVIAAMGVILTGCTEADVVSSNLSQKADSFNILRKVTFINTVTDKVLYTVEGNFSITADTADNQLEIVAKIGEDEYQKHFLGLSETTVYIVEQLEWVEENKYQFEIIVKPSALIPDVDVQ